MRGTRYALGFLVLIGLLLTACGPADNAPIQLEDAVMFEDTCQDYVLRVRYKGLEDDDFHQVEQLAPGGETIYASERWGTSGWFFWRDLTCDGEAPAWDAEAQSCRYDVRVTSSDGTQMSRREAVTILCGS